MGYYPPSLYRTYTEQYQTLPFDFLSDVVYQWERFARRFENFGTRVVLGRFSMILSSEGGALQTMKLPYKFYVGGKLGSGRQWYSWIHIDDLVRAILFTIDESNAKGPFNMASPILNVKIYLVIRLDVRCINHMKHGCHHSLCVLY